MGLIKHIGSELKQANEHFVCDYMDVRDGWERIAADRDWISDMHALETYMKTITGFSSTDLDMFQGVDAERMDHDGRLRLK